MVCGSQPQSPPLTAASHASSSSFSVRCREGAEEQRGDLQVQGHGREDISVTCHPHHCSVSHHELSQNLVLHMILFDLLVSLKEH